MTFTRGRYVTQLSAGKSNRLYEVPAIFAFLDRFERDPKRLAAIGASPRDAPETTALS